LLSLLPVGLTVDRILPSSDCLALIVRPTKAAAACPLCGERSARIHSHYGRRLADLPWQGRIVQLHLRARRFRCSNVACRQRIFTERLPTVMQPRARRTSRLRDAQQHIGLALGGEPGARLSRRLAMPVSGDTLLRLIRAIGQEPPSPPRVVGIDDWAWRRGQRYGTILCDLERNRVIDLLPDRRVDTVAAWLERQPSIEIVARDRASLYAEGARQGAPQAVQVADRWHLLRTLGEALQGAVDRHRKEVRDAARAVARQRHAERPPVAASMTKEDRLRHERRRSRHELYESMRELSEKGWSAEQIAPAVGRSPLTVRRWLAAGGPAMHSKPRKLGNLDRYAAFLDRRWAEGCRNATRLWRELREQGFAGGERTVRRWAARHRRARTVSAEIPAVIAAEWSPPSSRRCARLLTMPADQLADSERRFLAALAQTAPALVRAGEIATEFADLLRDRRDERDAGPALDHWIADARSSELGSFARGLERDHAAVQAALVEPWSTSPVEGQINRLKMLKRTMYGRAKPDLLRQRVLNAA
jgi:transposase